MRVIVLTGQSGSGKSTAIHALEDHGFLCVDNVPISLVENLIGTLGGTQPDARLAVVIDARQSAGLQDAPALFARLRSSHGAEIVYLEARDEAVLRRFSTTRRPHPLDRGEGLRAAIRAEREVLAPLRELADQHIDTSSMSPHVLRDEVLQRLAGSTAGESLQLALMSFGFKYGLPTEADMVFDVRFLPNPYFVENLRTLSGLDDAVSGYVFESEQAVTFAQQAEGLLSFLLPQFQREGKRYLTVAIGCTGGRHRSVAMVSELTRRLQGAGVATHLHHRDIEEAGT